MSTNGLSVRAFIIFCGMGLAACGGSDSDSDNESDSDIGINTLEGQFLDSAVEGLGFNTPTQSGTTDVNGTFRYLPGENITFIFKGQTLGVTAAGSFITPLDLQGTDKSIDYGLNIIRLFLTLDADGDPANGIKLDVDLPALNVNFDQSTSDFDLDPAVIDYVAANSNSVLATVSEAISHFSDTLAQIANRFNYSIDLRNRRATSVITTASCGPSKQAGWNYIFTPAGYSVTGSDSFDDCTVVYTDPLDGYSQIFGQVDEDTPFNCSTSSCTYAELNQTVQGIDSDGRSFYSIHFHTPNSNKFTYTKTVTAPEFETYKEVITLDNADEDYDLVGRWTESCSFGFEYGGPGSPLNWFQDTEVFDFVYTGTSYEAVYPSDPGDSGHYLPTPRIVTEQQWQDLFFDRYEYSGEIGEIDTWEMEIVTANEFRIFYEFKRGDQYEISNCVYTR